MPTLPRPRAPSPISRLTIRVLLTVAPVGVASVLAPVAGATPTPSTSTTSTASSVGPGIPSTSVAPSAPTTTAAPVPVTLTPVQVQQMSALQAQITHTGAMLDQLAETYDADTAQLSSLQQREASTRTAIGATQRSLAATRLRLRTDALIAYMGDVPLTDVTTVQLSASNAAALTSEYEQVAMANTTAVVSAYEADAHALALEDAALTATETQIQSDVAQIASARLAAMAAASLQQASLAAVSVGSAPPDPALAAAQSTGRGAVVADRNTPSLAAPLVAAIWAAASQVGVPYVWGGEAPLSSPGPGFDCSGLVQWAYRQAGIKLPRTAQEQHDAVVPVPAAQAAPGDLVFWNDGTTSVQHVAVYVGAGIVLQAPSTGSVVSYAPLSSPGLVGFGNPQVVTASGQ
jgi:peptidoglycan DL-endopeptidase CwlO